MTKTLLDTVQSKARDIDVLIAKKDYKSARSKAKALLKFDRSAGLAYQGVIDLRENRFLEAEQKLMESFQINAKQNLALANLIPVYLKLKESKKAVAFGEEAIKAMPGKEAVVLNYAAALMQEQEFRKAYDILYPLLDEEKPKKKRVVWFSRVRKVAISK